MKATTNMADRSGYPTMTRPPPEESSSFKNLHDEILHIFGPNCVKK
jgi:hypothetical protein